MRRKTLRITEQKNGTIVQKYVPVLMTIYFSQKQRGRTRDSWSMIRSTLPDSTECLYARAITNWSKACDKRLFKLISHFHCASGYRRCCDVGNTASGLVHDTDFAGDLAGFKMYVRRSSVFFRKPHICKKQTAVSHMVQKQKSFLWTLVCFSME